MANECFRLEKKWLAIARKKTENPKVISQTLGLLSFCHHSES